MASSAIATAQKYAQQALSSGGRLAARAGGQVQAATGSYSAPLFSNLAIARELGKQVYIAERLAPPTSVAELQTAYRQLFSSASSLAWWRSAVESGEWKRVGIYALEAYGIFSIGEMLGRRHVVGYKLN